jgi:hypothetical protein
MEAVFDLGLYSKLAMNCFRPVGGSGCLQH